jgi:hypothetical protein
MGAPADLTAELVHNEALLQEKTLLDAKSRQLEEEAEMLRETNQSLLESLEDARAQHTSEREYLSSIFCELEAQLVLARAEREELQSRSEHELRAATRRQRELEEKVARLTYERDQAQLDGETKCKGMRQVFGRAIRLQHVEAQADKRMLCRLERDMAELKEISASMLERDPRVKYDSFSPDGDRASRCCDTTGHGAFRRGRRLASSVA